MIDVAAIRAHAGAMRFVRGDDPGRFVSAGWAEMAAVNAEALCDRVEALEAALRECMAALEDEDDLSYGIARRALEGE